MNGTKQDGGSRWWQGQDQKRLLQEVMFEQRWEGRKGVRALRGGQSRQQEQQGQRPCGGNETGLCKEQQGGLAPGVR